MSPITCFCLIGFFQWLHSGTISSSSFKLFQTCHSKWAHASFHPIAFLICPKVIFLQRFCKDFPPICRQPFFWHFSDGTLIYCKYIFGHVCIFFPSISRHSAPLWTASGEEYWSKPDFSAHWITLNYLPVFCTLSDNLFNACTLSQDDTFCFRAFLSIFNSRILFSIVLMDLQAGRKLSLFYLSFTVRTGTICIHVMHRCMSEFVVVPIWSTNAYLIDIIYHTKLQNTVMVNHLTACSKNLN